MNNLKIFNQGQTDKIDLLNDEEMGFLFGGEDAPVIVSCQKGYTAFQCKCGYHGPAIIKPQP